MAQEYSKEEINKNYNTQVYGTETPNVVQTVKGGGGKESKKSSLRKKTAGVIPNEQKEKMKQTKPYVPFYKSFFN